MKALVGVINEEKALVGAFSVITNLRMDLHFKLYYRLNRRMRVSMIVQVNNSRGGSSGCCCCTRAGLMPCFMRALAGKLNTAIANYFYKLAAQKFEINARI